jgi:pyruvate-ferredoxin/flavodoxin oxidoreductase
VHAQAYFSYDAHKSGGVTVSHLRFGPSPIASSYMIEKADYMAVNHASYMTK